MVLWFLCGSSKLYEAIQLVILFSGSATLSHLSCFILLIALVYIAEHGGAFSYWRVTRKLVDKLKEKPKSLTPTVCWCSSSVMRHFAGMFCLPVPVEKNHVPGNHCSVGMINFTLWKNCILLEVVSRDMDGFDDQEMMPIVFWEKVRNALYWTYYQRSVQAHNSGGYVLSV